MFIKFDRINFSDRSRVTPTLFREDDIGIATEHREGGMCWLVGRAGQTLALVSGALDDVQKLLNMKPTEQANDD